ncbi:MAG: hypothetical protein WC551_03820 [Patescibacteria group bacterium]
MDLPEFQKRVAEFKTARDWHQFNQPKDLLLGMVEEIGEFRNLVKWEQDPAVIKKILVDECTPQRKEEIMDFFGDMFWYLGSLADYCGISLEEAMVFNLKELESRFPVDKVKGKTTNLQTGGFDGKYQDEAGQGSLLGPDLTLRT